MGCGCRLSKQPLLSSLRLLGVGGVARSGELVVTAAGSARDSEFTVFVAGGRKSLLRVAFLLCGDWAKAEDIVQVSLVKLYLAWARVHTSPETYARTIIMRSVVDEHRRPWRREVSTAETADVGREDPDPAHRLDLHAALLQLPLRQRQVVVLRYFEQLSVQETATTLGVTTGTVKSSCARGLTALNHLLTDGEELIRP